MVNWTSTPRLRWDHAAKSGLHPCFYLLLFMSCNENINQCTQSHIQIVLMYDGERERESSGEGMKGALFLVLQKAACAVELIKILLRFVRFTRSVETQV